MSSFMTINQKLELDRLLKMLEFTSKSTRLNATFNVYQLATLLRIYKDEPIALGPFKRTYCIGGSRLSRILEALCVLGLATRRRDTDRRKVIVQMTDEGRKFVEHLLSITL